MTYRIEIVTGAQRQFKKLPASLRGRISDKILSLETTPRSFHSIKLSNSPYYRLRVGDYRVLYGIDDKAKMVKILDIAHRREVYR